MRIFLILIVILSAAAHATNNEQLIEQLEAGAWENVTDDNDIFKLHCEYRILRIRTSNHDPIVFYATAVSETEISLDYSAVDYLKVESSARSTLILQRPGRRNPTVESFTAQTFERCSN